MKKALELAHAARKAKKDAGETLVRRNPLERFQEKPGRALAVNAKCFDCVGQLNADGGYRRAIRECPSKTCPLHSFRPYQRDTGDDDNEDAAIEVE
jgi:CTP:molybdopterin cytidylyltransferase MocA